MNEDSIKDYIKEIPDFPTEGISFKDISPLLADKDMFQKAVEEMGNLLPKLPDYWIGIESRGFLFSSALAYKFGGGVVMCRKAGKLPPPTVNYSYETEYSKDELSIKAGRGDLVIVDDVLATGGTLQATNHLCDTAGYTVQDNLVLIDLLYVQRIPRFHLNVRSLIQYESAS